MFNTPHMVTILSAAALLTLVGCGSVNSSLVNNTAAKTSDSESVLNVTAAVSTKNVVTATYVNEANVVVPAKSFNLSIVGNSITSANLAAKSASLNVTIATSITTQPSTQYTLSLLQTNNSGTILKTTNIPLTTKTAVCVLPVGPAGTIYKYMLRLTATKGSSITTSWSANDVKVTYK